MDLLFNSNNFNQKEFLQLLDKLCNDYYNNTDLKETVDDKIYDKLVEMYEKKFNTKYSKIGSYPIGIKAKLPYYMGSLDKVKTQHLLDLWLNRNDYTSDIVVMDKIDGISVLYYNNENTDKLYKRGDGTIGSDISYLIKYLNLPKIKNMAIRGELVIFEEDFEKYKNGDENISNARSTVSGITNSKNINIDLLKMCRFIAYQYLDDTKREIKKSEQLKKIINLGFSVPNYQIIKTNGKRENINLEVLQKIITEYKKKSKYKIDGLVLVIDKESELIINKNPKNSIAFKEEDDGVITKVINVEWNISKNGLLKPKVQVETVEIDDVKITYATAHNAKFVVDNGIGKNATIEIIRSGKVIPYIKKVINSVDPDLPDEKLNWTWNKTNVDIILNDFNNDDMKKKRIVDFFKQLDAKFLGEKTIDKLYNHGFNTFKKLFNITIEELISIEGIKKKSAEKIKNSIISSIQNVNLSKLMSASGIFGSGFGEKKISLIINKYPNILEIDINNLKINQIKGMKKMSDQFIDNLPNFIKFLKDHPEITINNENIEIIIEEELSTSHDDKKLSASYEGSKLINKSLKDQIIVFTGIRPDKTLEQKIIKFGGKITSAISGKTTMLITKGKDELSTKEKKAQEKGIKIMKYDDFISEFINDF